MTTENKAETVNLDWVTAEHLDVIQHWITTMSKAEIDRAVQALNQIALRAERPLILLQ